MSRPEPSSLASVLGENVRELAEMMIRKRAEWSDPSQMRGYSLSCPGRIDARRKDSASRGIGILMYKDAKGGNPLDVPPLRCSTLPDLRDSGFPK